MCFDRLLFNGRKREGDRTSQAFPRKGKGDHRFAMVDEVDLFFCKTNLHFANGEIS